MLIKTAQYVKSMQTEREKMKEEMQSLKRDLDKLQQAIR